VILVESFGVADGSLVDLCGNWRLSQLHFLYTGLRRSAEAQGGDDVAASLPVVRPTISEFSYGFAITSELIQAPGTLTAAPVFPSLIEEGQPGGGWDVRLDRPGIPLFLQFKLCDYMTRRSCREARDGSFNVPCYRMHLRSARVSRQHEMLLDLELSGQEVYYSAPMFHEPEELNAAFLASAVRVRSVWIRPSEIGPLPDERDHHVSFEPGSPWTLFSEPVRLKTKRDFKEVTDSLRRQVQERGRTSLTRESLEQLAEEITAIADKRREIHVRQKGVTREVARMAAPLQRVAYYASVFLESQLFVIHLRQEAELP
jgi:hypothetical protein